MVAGGARFGHGTAVRSPRCLEPPLLHSEAQPMVED